MQSTSPPVVPNLEQLREGGALVMVNERGGVDRWETMSEEDATQLPKSANTQSLAELLTGIFPFLRL